MAVDRYSAAIRTQDIIEAAATMQDRLSGLDHEVKLVRYAIFRLSSALHRAKAARNPDMPR